MESFNDALKACITACGGSKQVGPLLWPEKAPDATQRLLLDCFNDDRPARLAPEQVLFVLRLARSKGCHIGLDYICSELGYSTPTPIEPRDETAELMRAFSESVAAQAQIVQRMEKAASRMNMRVAA